MIFNTANVCETFFCMVSRESLDKDLDEITLDENNYDEEKSKKTMDYVYRKTTKHPLKHKLFHAFNQLKHFKITQFL